MRVFGTRLFDRWKNKNDLSGADILKAVREMENGLIDADLGGKLFKKRIATKGRGKRNSVRTILSYQRNDKSIFLFGFDKSSKANISNNAKIAYREFGQGFFELTSKEIENDLNSGELVEYQHEKGE